MAEPPDNKTRRGTRIRDVIRALRERLLTPAAALLRYAFDSAVWPFERAIWAFRKRILWPAQDLLAERSQGAKLPRAATFGAIGALAIGALGAGALVASGSDEDPGTQPAPLVAETTEPEAGSETITPILAKTEPKPEAPVMKGVRPKFGAKSDAERRAAKKALRKLKAQEDDGASDSSSATDREDAAEAAGPKPEGDLPEDDVTAATETGDDQSAAQGTATGATASNAKAEERRKESPLSVAERFAIAFVSYEVGTSGGPVIRVFKDTTHRDLFESLRKRPPRQPAGVKVPKARVMNVVGGPRKKDTMEASVGLLRVDGVSELRLEMKKADRGWVVKTVRG